MGVTYTFVDGTTAVAGEVNQNFTDAINSSAKNIKLNPFMVLAGLDNSFILPYSATRWETINRITTDAGATSTAGSATAANAWLCKADITKAYNGAADGTGLFTIDSGATWTSTSTNPPNVNEMIGCSYRLDGVIYLAGHVSSGTGLWYSTDDGANFAQVGTPAAQTHFSAVGMHDATHGIAIEWEEGSIWYTVDGTTWVDSGHSWISDSDIQCADVYVYASGANLTDFKCLILQRRSSGNSPSPGTGSVEYYDGTANSAVVFYGDTDGTHGTATNFVLLDNGTLSFAYANGLELNSANSTANIVSTTNPTASVMTAGAITAAPTFYVTPLGLCGSAGGTDVFEEKMDCMNQYDANKVLISGKNRKLWQVDLSGI